MSLPLVPLVTKFPSLDWQLEVTVAAHLQQLETLLLERLLGADSEAETVEHRLQMPGHVGWTSAADSEPCAQRFDSPRKFADPKK